MKEYWNLVDPRMPAPGFSAPPMAREPSVEEILARGQSEGEWLVPVELVLPLTSSAMKAVVLGRRARNEYPSHTARVIARGDRYFATIFFPGKSDLFFPLDCWAWGDWP